VTATIVFYISGHGFGHAARQIEVLNALHAIAPDIRLIVRTAAPRWLFDLTLRAPIDWRPLECDSGVLQLDSLTVDVTGTLRDAKAFYDALDARAAEEATQLRSLDPAVVVGDIPPLAFAAAHRAGIRSVAVGNFSWDWIYEGYDEAVAEAPDLLATIREAYSHAELALRLPLHGGFAPFGTVRDVPFIARRSRRQPDEVRTHFGLPDSSLVLASFGGYGMKRLDLGALSELTGYTVVLTANPATTRRGREVGREAPLPTLPNTVRLLDEGRLYAEGFRYEDLVGTVDVVATKPGYSIIAECAANDAAILYTSRGRFIEYDMLVREMPRYVRSEFISNEDLMSGSWQPALDRLMAKRKPPSPDVTGAEVVASVISSYVGQGFSPAYKQP
jgi:L-arabinokinase